MTSLTACSSSSSSSKQSRFVQPRVADPTPRRRLPSVNNCVIVRGPFSYLGAVCRGLEPTSKRRCTCCFFLPTTAKCAFLVYSKHIPKNWAGRFCHQKRFASTAETRSTGCTYEGRNRYRLIVSLQQQGHVLGPKALLLLKMGSLDYLADDVQQYYLLVDYL